MTRWPGRETAGRAGSLALLGGGVSREQQLSAQRHSGLGLGCAGAHPAAYRGIGQRLLCHLAPVDPQPSPVPLALGTEVQPCPRPPLRICQSNLSRFSYRCEPVKSRDREKEPLTTAVIYPGLNFR